MNSFTIIRSDRYGKLVDDFPDRVGLTSCTLDEAVEIAMAMSSWHAGCDYAFYVEEDPDHD